MKISRIWDSPKNKYLVNVEMDSGLLLTLPQYFMKKSHLAEDLELTDEEIDSLREEYIAPRVSKKALDYLSKRVYGRQELKDKLLDFGFLEEDIQPVIEKYTEMGYLNDREFARAYIHDALILRRKPERRIRYELSHKGVSNDDIEEAFLEFSGWEADNLSYLLERKLRSVSKDDREKLQKIKLQLMRKGYDAREIDRNTTAYFEREEL